MERLNVDDLSIDYQQADGSWKPTVHRVSLALAQGGSLGIVGESGSGKSTLARALMGYCRNGGAITEGTIQLGARQVAGKGGAKADYGHGGMAYVPQNPLSSLTPHVRVGEQVAEALRCARGMAAGPARLQAIALLEATGLPQPAQLFHRYPHQLSGGQRQRVVIAAAMATQPRVLILDEPTTALDKTTERQVLDLVQGLRERTGCSLVYVSHDLHVIARMCEQLVVMHQGHVVEQGPTQSVYQSPQHAYTRTLLAAMPTVRTTPSASPASSVLCAVPTAESDASSPHCVSHAATSAVRPPALKPAPVPPALLQVRGLRFSYARASVWRWLGSTPPSAPTLDDISFDIARGQTLGLVGESGSGKSTVAALVSGLCAPDAGQLSFDGEPLAPRLAQRSREARRRIQVIFQDPLSSLNPRHKVLDILTRPMTLFFGTPAAQARQDAEDLMRALQLDPALLDRYPRQLSGGQQQRVAIARAFAAKPNLIVCDEITSALDASIQAQVLSNLRQLQQATGTALLFISHDLGVIQQMAQRVMVLQRGQVRAHGDTETIFRHPPDAYTRLLLEASSAPNWVAPSSTSNQALNLGLAA